MFELARALGIPKSHLSKIRKSARISPDMAIRIEKLVGRDVMPREVICPITFAVEASA